MARARVRVRRQGTREGDRFMLTCKLIAGEGSGRFMTQPLSKGFRPNLCLIYSFKPLCHRAAQTASGCRTYLRYETLALPRRALLSLSSSCLVGRVFGMAFHGWLAPILTTLEVSLLPFLDSWPSLTPCVQTSCRGRLRQRHGVAPTKWLYTPSRDVALLML
jgi:hypothetical protein